jgi:hypothetical protein
MWVQPNVCGLFSESMGSWPLLVKVAAVSPDVSSCGIFY